MTNIKQLFDNFEQALNELEQGLADSFRANGRLPAHDAILRIRGFQRKEVVVYQEAPPMPVELLDGISPSYVVHSFSSLGTADVERTRNQLIRMADFPPAKDTGDSDEHF